MKQSVPIPTTARLHYNNHSRRWAILGHDLHCGECLEVNVPPGMVDGVQGWTQTRIEFSMGCWYLVGLMDLELSYLEVRVP